MIKGAVIRDGYKKTELGWIPEDWEVKRLGELCEKIGSGSTPRGGNEVYKDKGISLIRSQNVLDFDFSYDGLAFIDDIQASLLKNVTVLSNDILINITGDSVARVCMVPESVLPARVNQHVSILRTTEKFLLSKFLKYYLLNPVFKNHLLILANSGGTRNALTKDILENLKILLPPLAEQKKIAKILSTWDEAIEKLNSYIEAKKKLKKALMQRLLTGKQRFKEFIVKEGYKKTELGWIPEDWEVKRLGDVVDCQSGGTPSRASNELWNGSIPWMKIEDMTKANKYLFKTSENITEEGLKASSARLFLQETVFLAMYASVGKVCISKIPVTCNQAILGFYQSSNLDMEYLYYYLLFIEKLWQRNIQTGSQPNLNKNIVIGLQIFYPPLVEQKKIAEILSKADEEIDLLNQELEKLKTQKKGLMQKLLTGAWRVSCA